MNRVIYILVRVIVSKGVVGKVILAAFVVIAVVFTPLVIQSGNAGCIQPCITDGGGGGGGEPPDCGCVCSNSCGEGLYISDLFQLFYLMSVF
jgi:hypothetical protein